MTSAKSEVPPNTISPPRRYSEILLNLFYLGTGDLISRGLSIAAFVYVARVLGPEKLGLIGFGASAIALVMPIVDYGLGFTGMKEVSRNKGNFKAYLKMILFDRLVLGFISALCTIAVAVVLIHDPEKTRILLLYTFMLLPGILSLSWAYQGTARTDWYFIEKCGQATLYFAAVFVFVRNDVDFERIPLLYVLSSLIPAIVFLLIFFRKERHMPGTMQVREAVALLRSSFRLFVPTLLSNLSLPIGLLLVVYLSTLQEAGYFSATSKIVVLTSVIPTLLWSSFYPTLSRSSASEEGATRSVVAILYKYAILIGIVPAFLGLLYSRELVGVIYGQSYSRSDISFQLFSVAASLQFLSIVFTRILPAFDLESAFSKTIVLGVIIQIIFSIVLVPHFTAAGAAFAYALSEAFVAIVALRMLQRRMKSGLLRPAILSIGAISLSYAIVYGIALILSLPLICHLIAVVLLYVLLLRVGSFISLKDFQTVPSAAL